MAKDPELPEASRSRPLNSLWRNKAMGDMGDRPHAFAERLSPGSEEGVEGLGGTGGALGKAKRAELGRTGRGWGGRVAGGWEGLP